MKNETFTGIDKMNKKELKSFINENGFFLQVDEIEKVKTDELYKENFTGFFENSIRTKAKIPQNSENIQIFKGRATQKFKKGEVSRNGYKIDVEGWNWNSYMKNPLILLQHDSDYPIGKVLEILPNDKGVDIVYFVDYATMNSQDAHRVQNGYFSALSTGHITHEVMFENAQTGKRISEKEYFAIPWEDRSAQAWNLVVTKAEAVEISVVAIPSNPEALTVPNSLSILFEKIMTKNETEIVPDATPAPAEPAEPATNETPTPEVAQTETPAPEQETVENTVTSPETPKAENTPQVEPVPVELLSSLVATIQNLNDRLQKIENNTAEKKAVIVHSQFGENQTKKEDGNAVTNWLKSQGYRVK